MTNVLGSRPFARVTGLLLALVALAGYIVNAVGDGVLWARVLEFDQNHNHVHLALAVLSVFLGTWRQGEFSFWYARVIGIVYLGLGILGFIPATVDSIQGSLGLHLEVGESLLHLLLGFWGVTAGFLQPPPAIDRTVLPDLE